MPVFTTFVKLEVIQLRETCALIHCLLRTRLRQIHAQTQSNFTTQTEAHQLTFGVKKCDFVELYDRTSVHGIGRNRNIFIKKLRIGTA